MERKRTDSFSKLAREVADLFRKLDQLSVGLDVDRRGRTEGLNLGEPGR